MTDKVYVGDVGTVIEIDMQEDLSQFTNLQLFIRKPKKDSTEYEVKILDATMKTGSSNGDILQCIIIDGSTSFFDIDGIYYLQPYGEVSGWSGYGDTVQLTVYKQFS